MLRNHARKSNWHSLSFNETLTIILLLISVTIPNAHASLSSSFKDRDVDGIDDRVEVFLRLSPLTQDTDGDNIPDSLEFTALSTNAALMVDPNVDTDNEGIRDLLEIYGYYVDGTTIRGLKRIISPVDWEAFKNRSAIDGYPVYFWAANAIESSGLIIDGSNAEEEKLLDVDNVYQAIYNEFIANGLPETHRFIVGSPTELGTIASIIGEFVSIYPPVLPTLNDEPLPVYYTDPSLRSSDWDPYSDHDEVLGLFGASEPATPADDPLIGAIPDITTHLDKFVVTDIKELREANGTLEQRTDVERFTRSESRSRGFTVSISHEWEWTAGPSKVFSHSWQVGASTTNSWTFGTARQTEVREAFGVTAQTTDVAQLNCFAKLQMHMRIANNGSDMATATLPKWYIYIAGTLWQTLSGSEFLGTGPTLRVGDEELFTVLGQSAGDAACLTRDEAHYLSNGGGITISTGLESAEVNYYDENSGVILSGGNWTVYKANYEQHMARINLTVFTTTNTELNKTFWVRAYDKTNNLPDMQLSVKEVLEKAYTPVNCNTIGYPNKSLCLQTDNDGYILLSDESNFDFQFFDNEGQPLDIEAAAAAYQALAGDPNTDLLSISLPRGTFLTIDDYSARAPEFASIDAIVEQYNQTDGQHLEIRAVVSDYYGIDTVQFCKSDNDCHDMSPPPLSNQSENPANGYYTLVLTDYALQGTEYLTATNVVGNATTQSPTNFYLSLVESAYNRVDSYSKRLTDINQWLSDLAVLNVADPSAYQEIFDNNLMDDEATITATYQILLDSLNQAKEACAFNNAQALDDAETLLAQKTACDDAVNAYEQALANNPIRAYNPYKIPLKNILIADDKGIAKHSGSGEPSHEQDCHLNNLDVVTGMQIGYNAGGSATNGTRLYYRTIKRTDTTDPLYTWSAVKSKTCGDSTDIGEKQWIAEKDALHNNTLSAITDFGWSVKAGDVDKFCVVYWEFDLNKASFVGDYNDYCSGTSGWSGIEARSNHTAYTPGGNPGPRPEAMNDIFTNARYAAAQATYARHFRYAFAYQNIPASHNLVHGRKYRIRANNGKLLTLVGIQDASRNIALQSANNQDDQIWIVDIVNDREFRLRPKSFNGYLARPNLDGAGGNFVSVIRASDDDETTVDHNQHWRLKRDLDKYSINSVVNFKSLSRQSLGLETESPSMKQRWVFDPIIDDNKSLTVELESLAGQSTFSPFIVQNDTTASSGQYVVWPNNGSNRSFDPATSNSTAGRMRISFNLSHAADVQFDIRVNMPGGGNDSFWYRLDYGNWQRHNSPTSGYRTKTPKTFTNLAAGPHTLTISRREDGAQLDTVMLTTSAGTISRVDSLTVELESLSGQSNFSPLVVQNDTTASSGQYVVWPNNGDQSFGTPTVSANGQMQINFNLSQTADVQFGIRVNMPGGVNDSFWYKLDSGTWNRYNNITNGWLFKTPMTFTNLPAGSHTLRIVRREDGAKLDVVRLTASAGTIGTSQ